MSYISTTTLPLFNMAQTTGSWASAVATRVVEGLDQGAQSLVSTATPCLATTHQARMGAELAPAKDHLLHMTPPPREHPEEVPFYEVETTDHLGPDLEHAEKQEPADIAEIYRTFHRTIGLLGRTIAGWAAAPYMHDGGKALMASVHERGEQPEAFQTVMGDPFKDEHVADPMALRMEGAIDKGLGYVWWAPLNYISLKFAAYALQKIDEQYAAGEISLEDYTAQRKIYQCCKFSNQLMLADAALFVGSFLYIGTAGHSEELATKFLLATQIGNVIAHGAMFMRNVLLIKYNHQKGKESGKDNTAINVVFLTQAGSLAAFLGQSAFLVIKAMMCTDSTETVNDVLMAATNYPLWFLSSLIAAKAVGSTMALLESGFDCAYSVEQIKFIQAMKEKVTPKIATPVWSLIKSAATYLDPKRKKRKEMLPAKTPEQMRAIYSKVFESATSGMGSLLMLGAVAMSHPSISYNAPWPKAAATTLFLIASYGLMLKMVKPKTWSDGFWNGLARLNQVRKK